MERFRRRIQIHKLFNFVNPTDRSDQQILVNLLHTQLFIVALLLQAAFSSPRLVSGVFMIILTYY